MEEKIVQVPEVCYILQRFTSERVQEYIKAYSEEMVLIVANANIETLGLSSDKNRTIEEIIKENPSDFIKNRIGPAIGGAWLISGKQIEENITGALDILTETNNIEIKEMLERYLSTGLIDAAYSLDGVVDAFANKKEAIGDDLDMELDTADSIISKYLKIAIRDNFGSTTDFANAFSKKYGFDRIRQGDYYLSSDPADINRNLIMVKFNHNLAPKLISTLASELFYDISDN